MAAAPLTPCGTEDEEESPPPSTPSQAAPREEHREQHHYNRDAPPGGMAAEDVAAVEAVLGYEFADKYLVELALTHASFYFPYRTGDTYERLEYLGDAVLTCLVSREVFRTYRTLPPGPLTRPRAANVDKEKLARVAVGRGLHRFLRHKAPQLEGQVEVLIDGELVGSATYAQKKEIAQNRDAKAALDKLKETIGQTQSESAGRGISEPFNELDIAGTLK
ncbi:hypothetical protein HU200_006020 [Digitaria exilis]|uniref:RNase III domain-containing protein n=1 Tax=Digitaria exilis TaxID=1010633 RepID=A0A835FT90_9POAL|nr:hypothetical protein HU200_006020 [Digitaria exilis]